MVEGRTESLSTGVGWMASDAAVPPRISYVPNLIAERSSPAPVVALPWGSRSTRRTRDPASARHAPRLTAVVVFPTPPFWLLSAKIWERPFLKLGVFSGRIWEIAISAASWFPPEYEEAPRRLNPGAPDLDLFADRRA